MSEPPTTWIGLLGVIILVAGPIITTVVAASRGKIRADRRAEKIGTQVTSVSDQVVNSHGDLKNNLRDDVDRVIRTGDQTQELLLDTHRILTDHHGHIQRLGDRVADHTIHIQKISRDVDGLHNKVDKWSDTPPTGGTETGGNQP